MRFGSVLLFVFITVLTRVYAQTEAPQQSLNHYITFLSKSTDVVTGRFEQLANYQQQTDQYRKRNDFTIRLPSSGPLEEFYYRKALEGKALTGTEKQKLNAATDAIWKLLNTLDETSKALETYISLKDYQTDHLKRSDVLTEEMISAFDRFSREKRNFYRQIQQIYHKYQPYSAADPYLQTEKAMEEVLVGQQQLLDLLPYYLDENSHHEWPVAQVKESMLNDEKLLATIGDTKAKLAYPASDILSGFKSAILSMQDIKRLALDDHTFAAAQSARHGNEVYLSLLKAYNYDLLAHYKSFVDASQSVRKMLYYPAFSPLMRQGSSQPVTAESKFTPQFQDKPVPDFTIKKASAPASAATVRTLNQYIDLVNESLRQMHYLQVLLRNYQSSAEYYRDPASARKRANLSYAHDDYKLPASDYALLQTANSFIPQPYRAAISVQTEVLINILQEMNGLSIELINYTTGKQYLNDQLKRSDEILDRYAYLFDVFDKKKEQLYHDIRRIHEHYPNATPSSSWYIAGSAMLKTMDDDHALMFDVRDFLRGETAQLPETGTLEKNARQLIADEYQNLKGLQRYGRSNGLCPYSPYEDLAGNSARFAEKAQKLKSDVSASSAHPYESFYYFYNNELVYQYNKFIELSKAGLLKTINQPDVFVFRRTLPPKNSKPPVSKPEPQTDQAAQSISQVPEPAAKPVLPASQNQQTVEKQAATLAQAIRDTVYVERIRVDTVYVDRTASLQNVTRSLEGFAPNNMVLLLDVSSSMNSPFKMPLLKRSIKSLLTLLRPEDQISIVLYSGKARVVLKPTSGSKSAEIARMIDLLQSDGDTDGNEGIKLAYKTANKQYLRAGNNRIVLATDGEFPISDEVYEMIGQNARQDVYLSVFTFGRNQHTGQKLKKLSELGKGSYAHVTEASADLQLILEAQAKKEATK